MSPNWVVVTDVNMRKDSVVYYCPIGIAENEIKGNVSLHPNPNSGQFFLKLENLNSGNYEVAIFNLIGQRLQFQEIWVNGACFRQMVIKGVRSGLYYLRITDSIGKQITMSIFIE